MHLIEGGGHLVTRVYSIMIIVVFIMIYYYNISERHDIVGGAKINLVLLHCIS